MRTIKTAVVGFGFSAKVFHLPFLTANEQFEVTAISTSQQASAATAYPNAKIFADPVAMIQATDADLVINTAPNVAHYSLSALALEMGKHVVVEKPFVATLAEGEALIALAEKQNRVLSVYQNRRWDGDFLTVKKLIEEGKLGNLKYVETHFDRFRPVVRPRWREQPGVAAGILFDLAPHLLDQMLGLFGKPDAVTGRVLGTRPNATVDDYFHIQLHYADKEVVVHSSPHVAAPMMRFMVQGSQGSYVKYGLDPQEARLIAGISPTNPHWSAEDPAHYGTFYTAETAHPIATETGGYQHYFHTLAQAILHGKSNPVSAESALDNIRLILLAQQSSKEGKTLLFS